MAGDTINDYALGYHGTSAAAAESILATGFHASRNRFDWLGDGIYFWQDAPRRALEWARRVHRGDNVVVLSARIRLVDCMDLLDLGWYRVLSHAHDQFVEATRRAEQPLPLQRGLAHGLDRAVINYACGVLAEAGTVIKSIRAAFAEGEPAFPNSALLDLNHVQIAVRDTSVIEGVQYVEVSE